MKVGIIGCGNIGTELALFINRYKFFPLNYLFDIDKKNIEKLIKKIKNSNPKFFPIDELIRNSDLIIEAANKDAVKDILKNKSINKKYKKILFMSTGGLIDNLNSLKKIKNAEIYLPSGAIAGLDAIKAVSGKMNKLTLTTTKPITGLQDAPYIQKNKINLKKIKRKRAIFEGKLEDAVEGFPQNINVAATLFLASKFKNLKIKIIADPKAKTNTHEILCEGKFGKISIKTENFPSKNPKTSHLAVLSAIQTLRNIRSNVKVGT